MTLNDDQISEFQKYYSKGCKLQENIILLDGYQPRPLNIFGRYRAKKAIKSFERALSIYPESWQSLFFIGKIYQRMREFEASLNFIEMAMKYEQQNHVLPQEASLVAMHLKDLKKAIDYSVLSVSLSPDNIALLGNHAMNLLVAGFDSEAQVTIENALKLDPNDDVNKRIKNKIVNVINGSSKRPTPENAIG